MAERITGDQIDAAYGRIGTRGSVAATITRNGQVIQLGTLCNTEWNWLQRRGNNLRLRLIQHPRYGQRFQRLFSAFGY